MISVALSAANQFLAGSLNLRDMNMEFMQIPTPICKQSKHILHSFFIAFPLKNVINILFENHVYNF